jgi:hypothetical protein
LRDTSIGKAHFHEGNIWINLGRLHWEIILVGAWTKDMMTAAEGMALFKMATIPATSFGTLENIDWFAHAISILIIMNRLLHIVLPLTGPLLTHYWAPPMGETQLGPSERISSFVGVGTEAGIAVPRPVR